MNGNFHLRDAAGKVDAIVSLSVYDPGMVNLAIYSCDDGSVHLLRDLHLPAATARKLATELLACADAADPKGGAQ